MSARETLLLHPDRPLRLDPARHAELGVESGIVWITSDVAAGDLFLAAGQRYRVPQDGVVLVEALRGMADVRLVACRRRWIPDLLESCRAMLPKGLATH
ncbi:MAG: DUF2917 domain-containing protein [Sulfuritalea sp.]|nr:DUF2917 domain-containing protein [Sulfuritalea sp.]